MSKKRITWIIIIIAVIAALAIPKLMRDKSGQPAVQAPGKKMPVKVSVYVAGRQDVERSIQATGNIMAEDELELRSEASGKVIKIYFEEGAEVRKGQKLLKVNDADLQAQLKRTSSSRKLKEETEKRNRQLLAKGAISQEAYDLALTDLNTTDADIELLKENIRKTEIIAPFNGIIGLRYISEGSYVTPASQIASLQNISRVKVEFSVPEKYASQISTGMEISFAVDGSTGKYRARVFAIEPKVDQVTRNVTMRALCDNTSRKLMPGSFAKVSIPLRNNPDALMIPTQSIVPILKGQKVYVVKGDSVIEKVVKTGVRTDASVEVTDGLQAGDSVVVNGVMYLKQGSKVVVSRK